MRFYLLKEYQGQGIGRLLIQSVVDDLKVLPLFRALGLHTLNDHPRQRLFPVLELRQLSVLTPRLRLFTRSCRFLRYHQN
jgi:GNAT superfamily N-acetyltransferase